MIKYQIVFLLLFFVSCRNKSLNTEQFQNELYQNLFSSYAIELIHTGELNTGIEIKGAPMSWVTLLRSSRLNKKMKEVEYICLGYRIPFLNQIKSKFGILKIHRSVLNTCPNLYSEDDKFLDSISMLRINYNNNILEFDVFVGKKGLRKNIQIPLMNIETKNDDGIYYIRYSRDGELLELTEKVKRKIPKFNYASKCFNINSKCDVIKKNNCNDCPYGSFEVAGGSCSQGGIRYCSPVVCGEKNMPACMRTKKVNREEVCYSKSTAGFCREGLMTNCNPDGLLICL